MSDPAGISTYPPRLRWLITSVLALALPVAVGAVVRIALDPPGAAEALAVLLFLSLALVAEIKPVPLEEEDLSTVSVAFVFILSGLILFGWEWAVVIAGISALAAQLVERRPLPRTAFNTAVYALSGFAAALPAFLFGDSPGDAVAVTVYALLGGAAFVAVNVAFISLAISFHDGVALRPLVKHDFRLACPVFGIQAFLAALAAALWTTDAWLLVLMAGPLFTVTLYQRSSLASRRAIRDAHTDSLTRLGNSRAYELALAAALEQAAEGGTPLSLCLVDVDDFKQINDMYGHQAGDRVLAEVSRLLTATGADGSAFRLGGDEFALLIPSDQEGARRHVEALFRRFSAADFSHGQPVTVSAGVATLPDHAADAEQLERVADGTLYWAKHKGKNRWCIYSPVVVRLYSVDELERRAEYQARLRAAENLVRVVDVKDEYTGAHSERVALLVEGIVRQLGFEDELAEQLKLAGRLHDLGKIAVSDSILQKPEALTPAEQQHVAAHPELGAALLDGMEIRPVDIWIRHHHEHWDGSGYPDGLSGEEIPLGSRVILVADAYDAITTDRTYRSASRADEALAELNRKAGVQFDPTIVAALEAHLAEAGLAGMHTSERAEQIVA